jgi:methionyl-tRNA synthetase
LLHNNVGSIPAITDLADIDRAALASSQAGFDEVGRLIGVQRQRQAIGEAMRVIGDANKYLADTAPWKLKTTDPERMNTVLGVAAQLVSDANTLMAPFLPHSAQKVHEALGGEGVFAPMPHITEVNDLDRPNRAYPIIEGDYTAQHGTWKRKDLVAGTPVPPPVPIFTKLDDDIVEAELERMRSES